MKRSLAGALALSAALALGACGDDEEEETTGAETGAETTALTKDAYIDQASEICARVNRDLAQIQNFPREGPPVIEDGLADLRALPAPEGEEERVDEMLSAGEQGLEEVQQQAEAGRPPRGDPFHEFTELAQDFGIEGGCTRARG